jgi:hypothetical protein
MISVPTIRVVIPQLVVSQILFPSGLESNADRARKILPRKCEVPAWMAFRSLHHRFDAKRLPAPEIVRSRLLAGEPGLNARARRFRRRRASAWSRSRFGFGFVHGVAFLPKEFRGAQEQTRAHFQRTTLAHWLMRIGGSR